MSDTENDPYNKNAKKSAKFIETEKGEIIEARDLIIEFFEDVEGSRTVLRAETGIYDKKTQILNAMGKVEIETDVRKIITSDVKWYPKKKKFKSDKKVVIFNEDGVIRGRGMEASMDLRDITIKNRIEGELEK